MPNRSRKPKADEVASAFDTMQHIIRQTEGEVQDEPPDELTRLRARVRELERLCDELRMFARVDLFPPRVVTAIEHAANGEPVGASLLPMTNGDFPESAASALGRAGGLKGGKARAASLSPKRRRAIALKAAKARWEKK